MRSSPNTHIWDLWSSGGPFVGDLGETVDGAPVSATTRVAVEPEWYLSTYASAGNFKDGPVRAFQKKTNDQYEVEIPNLRSVSIDRSLSDDAASCNIVLNNQWHYQNGSLLTNPNELGQPGYFTFNRGESAEASQRWGHQSNDWANILVPNALLRTYQGYGGKAPSGMLTSEQNEFFLTEDFQDNLRLDALGDIEFISTAVARGRLVQTGTWLIDEVHIGSDGNIEIRCRDMAKLLIEQQIFPPLVPKNRWPVSFCRYSYQGPVSPHVFGERSETDKQIYAPYMHYDDSSSDQYMASLGISVAKKYPESNSIDFNSSNYWLSEGQPSKTSQVWIQYLLGPSGDPIDRVVVTPRGNNYACFVSVMENGVWQGAAGYGITTPVVATSGLGNSGQAKVIKLPRLYQAQKVRLTLTNLQKVTDAQGPLDRGSYRCGLAEVRVGEYRVRYPTFPTIKSSRNITSIAQGVIPYTDSKYGKSQGYWLAGNEGSVFAIGPKTSSYGAAATSSYYSDEPWVDICSMYGNHKGYWTVRSDGRVTAFGAAQHYGGFTYPNYTSGIVAMDRSPDNAGYALLASDGRIYTYGSSTTGRILRNHSNVQLNGNTRLYTYANSASAPAPEAVMPQFDNLGTNPAVAIDIASTDNGFYVLDTAGHVYNFGDAIFYGDNSTLSVGSKMRGTPVSIATYYKTVSSNGVITGFSPNGYWVLTDSGHVYSFGPNDGTGPIYKGNPSAIQTGPCVDIIQSQQGQMGYLIASDDGNVYAYGEAKNWGDIYHSDSEWQLQLDGNYEDYTDIVKTLLLWSGWWLRDDNYSSTADPEVYGNIEDTGIFSDSCLPESMFDKRPVIDAINELKTIVGYNFWVDELGGAHFELPTWYTDGNFINETGLHTTYVPIVDELTNLFTYSVDYNDKTIRSKIIVATSDPMESLKDTKTSVLDADSNLLRGMTRPMMFVNQAFLKQSELDIMAELVGMQLNFQQRLGSANIIANPLLQIGDKVRIYERTTAESYVHYIRGIQTQHDLQTGAFTQTLTTNWLGNYAEGSWAIRFQKGSLSSGPQPDGTFVLSPETIAFLEASKNRQTAYTPIQENTSTVVVPPPPAGFSVNHNFVGWNFPLNAPSTAWDDIASMGSRIVRFDADWGALQPTNPSNSGPGQNDSLDATEIAKLDNAISEAQRTGQFVMLNVAYTPRWARPSYLTAPSGAAGPEDHIAPEREPANLYPDYANFIWLLAERYTRLYSGTVVAMGVWNEPNLSNFWMQPTGTGTTTGVNYTPDAGRYAQLLRGAYAAVKSGVVTHRPNRAAFPNMLILTGGTSPASGNGNGSNYSPANFVQSIISNGGQNSFDHLDHHPYCWDYGPNVNQSYNAFLQMHDLWELLKNANRTDAKIWASEIGVISRPVASGTDPASPFGTGGYSIGGASPPSGKWVTSAQAIDYTLGATRVDEMFVAYRDSQWYDLGAMKHILGPMIWYIPYDRSPGIGSTWAANSQEEYFGFKEYGTNGYDGPEKGNMLTVWESHAALDTSAPSGSIVTPTAGSTISGNVGIGVTATDDRDIYIEKVQILVDGNVVGQCLPGLGYVYIWDSSTVSNGTHSITALLTDNAGNSNTTSSVSVTVSNGSSSAANGVTDYRSRGTLNAAGVENPRLWNTNTSEFDPPVDAFYVDAATGSDLNDGSSPTNATRTIATAWNKIEAGTQDRTIVVNSGEYRGGHAPSTQAGVGGATKTSKVLGIQANKNASVWIKGSDLFADWLYQGGYWVYNGSYVPSIAQPTGGNAPYDQLFVDDVPYKRVATKPELTAAPSGAAGTFWVDTAAHKIWIGNASNWVPANHKIEVTTRAYILGSSTATHRKNGFFYKGIGFAHWGTDREPPANDNHGAVKFLGTGQSVSKCVFAYSSFQGLDYSSANGFTMTDVLFLGNGGLGYHAYKDIGTTATRVRIGWSNWRHDYNPAAGPTAMIAACKVVGATNPKFTDVISHNNWGHGIWVSDGCIDVEAYRITAGDNYGCGFYDELGDGLKLVDAVFYRNGNTVSGGLGGYKLSGVSNVHLWNITSIDNVVAAFGLFEDSRTYNTNAGSTLAAPLGPGDNVNITYKNNVNVGTSRATFPLLHSFNVYSTGSAGAVQQLGTFSTEQMFAADPYAGTLVTQDDYNVWIRLSTANPQFKWAEPTASFTGTGSSAATSVSTSRTLTEVKAKGCETHSIAIDDNGAAITKYFPNAASDDYIWGSTIPSTATSTAGAVPPDWVCAILGIANGATAHYGAYNAPRLL